MFNWLTRGKITISPEKYSYSPGEVVKGKVALQLKKPTQANKFSVSLTGQTTYTTYQNRPAGQTAVGPESQQHTDQIFYFELPLDGVKEYTEGEYSFEIKIPENVLSTPSGQMLNMDSVLGKTIEVAATLGAVMGGARTNTKTEWFLKAQLDISGAMDMREGVNLNIA